MSAVNHHKILAIVWFTVMGLVVILCCALAFSIETNLIYPGSKLAALSNFRSDLGPSGLKLEVEYDFTTQARPADVLAWYAAKQWDIPLGYCSHCYEVTNHYMGIGFGIGFADVRWKLVVLINSTNVPIEIYQLNSFEISFSLRPH
jgi:hypothetical protein